uniref:DUF4158 domain-containing protein n=2 Tax=Streptomyces TaxID=1883 RepID=UPI00386F875B|nr:DUF4158 domain-containing protein [Streptomyces sp. NBC_01014]
MLGFVVGRVGILTPIERTAYPRFKRLITAHELHLFFSPTREEAAWAAERMDADGHQLALLLALKSYQRMGRFPKPDKYPEMVVDFARRAVELHHVVVGDGPDRRAAAYEGAPAGGRDVRPGQSPGNRRGVDPQGGCGEEPSGRPDQHRAGEGGGGRAGAAAFSTFDAMASKIRSEVNTLICTGIHDRMSVVERTELLRLLEDRDGDGTTLFNQLKKPAQGPT